MSNNILIKGARVNNLKNLTLEIPRGKLVVVTGISGSGKSSLVFDTLYAEGQRRFSESLSSYARQFLGRMSKPDVDLIDGIPPAIAIEQKVTTRNPRSTVATTTEIYDFLRLVFSRIGRTYSPVSGREVHKDTASDVVDYLMSSSDDTYYVLSPVAWDKIDRTILLLGLKEDGFSRLYSLSQGVIRIDDLLQSGVDSAPSDIYLLVDRYRSGSSDSSERSRLLSSVQTAFSRGDEHLFVIGENTPPREFCSRFELDGIKFRENDENLFSFNSPLGACPVCGGLGKVSGISEDLVVPDKSLSLYDGAIAPWRGEKMVWFKDKLIECAGRYGIPVFEPYCNLSKKHRDLIWHTRSSESESESFVGIDEFFEWVDSQKYKIQYKYMLSRFSGRAECPACRGTRLTKEALWVKVQGKTIADILSMTIAQALDFFTNLALSEHERSIVSEALSEILSRLECLCDVGLPYLTLDRACNTLSGGESQRISLVTALGSSLVGSMYILDEPSIGLHPRDTERLISVLKRLRDLGNTVIVVEHDEEIMRSADLLIDMGPLAGARGGEVIYKGKLPSDLSLLKGQEKESLTLKYLCSAIARYKRQKRTPNYWVEVRGAMEHNLKDINVRFPLGVMTVVSGVSGSGKSSLVGDILYPALKKKLVESSEQCGVFRSLEGSYDRLADVEYVDQNPIGRSSRSNAATYLKAYDDIRRLLADQQASKIAGFSANYFSFNTEGGRCPECQGEGVVHIPMQFVSDVDMVCESCGGKRFKAEVLEVRYRGKNVDDILNMSVDEAVEFFSQGSESAARSAAQKLSALKDVGLGYIKLGQSSSTLSGGESQRIKLAYYLSVSRQGGKQKQMMFIFDEPTTGLHFHDVEILLKAFDTLLAAGHTLVIVEHNPDVIKAADWIIDLGPDAGSKGGQIVYQGRPEDMKGTDGFTAKYVFAND
ncbi:MAG: excinuclease ABC subunit UvrA [Candidatus Cryptobacteroides sp.]